jgi:hypothetical protein
MPRDKPLDITTNIIETVSWDEYALQPLRANNFPRLLR